ncbi:MAG: pyrroline-5-carboxylate reductase [Deltaproteobacteria bacterium]|nr:pyrroline-5-carboxylate reductase [Deltaproteobacteria bacterium]
MKSAKKSTSRGQQQRSGSRVAIVGCGNIGAAILGALARSSNVGKANVIACDVDSERLEAFQQELGVAITTEPREAAELADTVILAVKPKHVRDALIGMKGGLSSQKVLLSVAAGWPIEELRRLVGKSVKVGRVMPNFAVGVGLGMSCVFAEDVEVARRAEELFSATGMVYQLGAEAEIDAVTGLSASGIAFVFAMLEGLQDGGLLAGLPREAAQLIAAQTALGAAGMVLDTGLSPSALKESVVTPAGTTIAGLMELETKGVRAAFANAVNAATERARAIGKSIQRTK